MEMNTKQTFYLFIYPKEPPLHTLRTLEDSNFMIFKNGQDFDLWYRTNSCPIGTLVAAPLFSAPSGESKEVVELQGAKENKIKLEPLSTGASEAEPEPSL